MSSLLLVAHGSSAYPDAAHDLARLAARIRATDRFARVDIAFWRQEPHLTPDLLIGEKVFVVPYFAGIGKHSQELIPDRLGLSGAATRRGQQTIFYCQPVGAHPRMPQLIDRRARQLCEAQGMSPRDSSLLLIGHGSRSGAASQTPEAIGARLRATARWRDVVTVYLEQAPLITQWPTLVQGPNVIAQPLLLSAGMHMAEDIPPALGLTGPDDCGPVDCHGHRLWLQRGIGEDDDIIALILDQVAAAA